MDSPVATPPPPHLTHIQLARAAGMNMLKVVPVSKQQADQRRGRAGRTSPGQCYRVYPRDVYESQLAEETVPEIQRVSISQVVLQLKTIGVKSPQVCLRVCMCVCAYVCARV